jgi:hypothetical protein
MRSNRAMFRLHCVKNKASLLFLAFKPGPKCHIWKNRIGKPTAVSAESHFACHALINASLAKLWKSFEDNGLSKMEPSNAACRARSSTSSFPTSPTWDGIHINFTSIPFWHRLQHNCLHWYTRGWVWCAILIDNIVPWLNSGYQWV